MPKLGGSFFGGGGAHPGSPINHMLFQMSVHPT